MITIKITEQSEYPLLLDVYNYYIENSTATFHLNKLSLDVFLKSIPIDHQLYKTYSIYYNQNFCGYLYMGNYKPREAYLRTAEVTIYLHPEFLNRGIGKFALEFIHIEAKKAGIKNLIGVVSAENEGSIALFTKVGYEKVAQLKRVGEKFGRIIDILFFQKEL